MRFLADENFNNRILRKLQDELPELDVTRVQDTVIYEADDATVLEWAATQNRILITHDVQTITKYAYNRVKDGLPMPGIIEVHSDTPIGQAVDELLLMIGAGTVADFENQVKYIPIA